MKMTTREIENRLAELDPDIELLLFEQAGSERRRLVIDHPGGVSLELCQQVTSGLSELLAEYSLEVSSPGTERPLAKPAHFAKYAGRRARVTTVEPIEERRNFTGTLLEPDEHELSIECDGVTFRVPYEDLEHAHLVSEIPEGAAK